MATKPTDTPRWATDGAADIVEPSEGYKDLGWVAGNPAPAGYANWLAENNYDWQQYLEDITDELLGQTSGALKLSSLNVETTTLGGFVKDVYNAIYNVAGSYWFCVTADRQFLKSVDNGKTWTTNSLGAAGIILKALATNGTNIYAAGQTGRIYGVDSSVANLENQTVGSADFLAGMFGSSTYVFAGTSGTLYSAPDSAVPLVFTSRTSTFGSSTIRDGVFGNSLFVIVGDGGKIATSSNGTSWTLRVNGTLTSQNYRAVIWDAHNALFIATGVSGVSAYSADGITWTANVDITGTPTITGLATDAKGLTVGIATDGSIYYTGDGKNFAKHGGTSGVGTLPTGLTPRGIDYHDGNFIFLGASGATYRGDMRHALRRDIDTNTVAIATTNSTVSTLSGTVTTNATTMNTNDAAIVLQARIQSWENYHTYGGSGMGASNASSANINRIFAYNPGGGSAQSLIMRTSTGVISSIPALQSPVDATAATIEFNTVVATSYHTDGTTWFLSSSDNTNNVYTATDPTGTWTARGSITGTDDSNDIFTNTTNCVVVGANNKVYYNNGTAAGAWSAATPSLAGKTYSGVAYGNSIWVVVASDGTRMSATTPSGTWTTRTGTAMTVNSLYFDGTYFWVLGTAGKLDRSSDGITWTACTLSDTNLSIKSLALLPNSIYLLGGVYSGGTSDLKGQLWYSSDAGVTFTNALGTTIAAGITSMTSLVYLSATGKVYAQNNQSAAGLQSFRPFLY